jgi:K+-transporting ATPase ATPase A chain
MATFVLIKPGSITPGGDGYGLYRFLFVATVAVFVAGLVVGRTPGCLGTWMRRFEIEMASLLLRIVPRFTLTFAGLASVISQGTSVLLHRGPHGKHELLQPSASARRSGTTCRFAGVAQRRPGELAEWARGFQPNAAVSPSIPWAQLQRC